MRRRVPQDWRDVSLIAAAAAGCMCRGGYTKAVTAARLQRRGWRDLGTGQAAVAVDVEEGEHFNVCT